MSDARQCWATPPDFFKWLDDMFHFDIDVCASAENAKCPAFITEEEDSFSRDWFYNPRGPMDGPKQFYTAFCNPGFAKPLAWHQRAFQQTQNRLITRVACVLGVQWASQEWAEFAYNNTLMIIHLSPRIQYLAPPGVKQSSNNYESVVYVYSSLPACPGNVRYVRWDPKPRRARKAKA